jgi:hypothetical protein
MINQLKFRINDNLSIYGETINSINASNKTLLKWEELVTKLLEKQSNIEASKTLSFLSKIKADQTIESLKSLSEKCKPINYPTELHNLHITYDIPININQVGIPNLDFIDNSDLIHNLPKGALLALFIYLISYEKLVSVFLLSLIQETVSALIFNVEKLIEKHNSSITIIIDKFILPFYDKMMERVIDNIKKRGL